MVSFIFIATTVHVVVRREPGAVFGDGFDDGVDDFAGGQVARALDDLDSRGWSELLALLVHRFGHAVRTEDEDVAAAGAETTPRRTSTPKNDPSGTPGSSIGGRGRRRWRESGYGTPELASVTVRRFRSKTA